MKIGVLIISTGSYHHFIDPLIESLNTHFFRNDEVEIFLFTDRQYNTMNHKRLGLSVFPIIHAKWPLPTLYRYKWFTAYADHIKADYIYYMDVDMLVVSEVGREIIPNNGGITATRHPGYWRGGWGDNLTTKESLAYIPVNQRGTYYAGGFQGGQRDAYLKMAEEIATYIDIDYKKGIIAAWHDESHFNRWLTCHSFMEISPAYCFPQAAWAKDLPFEKKILALDKNHKELRK